MTAPHPLVTERELDAAYVSAEFARLAAEISQQRAKDAAGFAVVVWNNKGAATCYTLVGESSPIPRPLVTQYVAEAVRQDLSARYIISLIEQPEANAS